METFASQLMALTAAGYKLAEAQAKVAHDAVLFAMHKSGFKRNCTVKGGVVMCELTKAVRRTTMDIDIDFVRYSISETSIKRVVARWARESGLRISLFGTVQDLRQQDYHGKRVYLDITDGSIKAPVRTKVDIGVHTHAEIIQDERRFGALSGEKSATLFANPREQIFAEKLLSLIKHGALSTRAKDVFDLYYLTAEVECRALRGVLDELILANKQCPIREPPRILDAVGRTFQSKRFLRNMSSIKANWIKESPAKVTAGVLAFLRRVLL